MDRQSDNAIIDERDDEGLYNSPTGDKIVAGMSPLSAGENESSDEEDRSDGSQPDELDELGGVDDGIMEEQSRSSTKRAASTETLESKPSISPAKRFRYDFHGLTPFDVVDLPCIRGRHLKVPIVLPTLSEKDMKKLALVKKFVLLTHRTAWLSSVCLGRVSGGKIMDAASKRVRHDLLKAVVATERKKQAAATAGAAACRRQLLGRDDSEPVAAIEGDTAVSSAASGVYTIEHGGQTFQVVKKASSIYVEGTPEILNHVCNLCLDAMVDETMLATAGDAVTEVAPSAASLESTDAVLAVSSEPDLRTPIQRGGLPVHVNDRKVQWMMKRNSFQVTYHDATGAQRRCVAGLKVLPKDKDGTTYTPEQYREVFCETLRNAKSTWNRLDMTSKDRFNMEGES